MIQHIKSNLKNYIIIAACVAALVAMNAHIEHITRGSYNIITLLFV